MTTNLEWGATFTVEMEPVVNESNMCYIQQLLTKELAKEEYRALVLAEKEKRNIPHYYHADNLDTWTNAVASGITNLTGSAWKIDKATTEIYWNDGSFYPWRCNEDAVCMVAGTFPKRIKAIAWKRYGIKFPDTFIATLGEQARRAIGGEDKVTYYARLTNRIDWNSGDFGDSGSCYWGDRSHAKQLITGNGGGAVQLFSDSDRAQGISRCWIMPADQGYMVFNAYGTARLDQFAAMLADHLGLRYDRCECLMNDGDTDGTLYINGGTGYYLHPADAPALEEWDFDIADFRYHCEYCGDGLYEDDIYRDPDGDPCCESCFNDRFDICYGCDEPMRQDDAIYCEDNGNSYCEDCARRRDIMACEECGEYHKLDYMTTTADDRTLCDGCLSKDYTECDECNQYHPDEDVTRVDGRDFCPDCLDDQTEVCADCGARVLNRDAEDWDGVTVCDTCFAARSEQEQLEGDHA